MTFSTAATPQDGTQFRAKLQRLTRGSVDRTLHRADARGESRSWDKPSADPVKISLVFRAALAVIPKRV